MSPKKGLFSIGNAYEIHLPTVDFYGTCVSVPEIIAVLVTSFTIHGLLPTVNRESRRRISTLTAVVGSFVGWYTVEVQDQLPPTPSKFNIPP